MMFIYLYGSTYSMVLLKNAVGKYQSLNNYVK